MALTEYAREVKYAIADPVKLCNALGLSKGAKSQGGGLSICCPVHGERNPSCSVTRGPDGTVRVRCFGCDFSGDALHLVAIVHNLNLRSEFKQVLATGAELGGALGLRDEILAGERMPERERVAAPEARPLAAYPPVAEVEALWGEAQPVSADPDAWEALRGRGIDPDQVDRDGVARVIPLGSRLPHWARYRGATWLETGHRVLVPMWDPAAALVSVRAWRITPGDTPKRLPPAGHRSSGIVMANRLGWMMLRGRFCPRTLVVVEGEPDFVSVSIHTGDPVIGLISGSWVPAFADRVPRGTAVVLATHNDEAGDRYADAVAQTLGKCQLWRAA